MLCGQSPLEGEWKGHARLRPHRQGWVVARGGREHREAAGGGVWTWWRVLVSSCRELRVANPHRDSQPREECWCCPVL